MYFESYSRRESLKFIGFVENSNNAGNNQSSAESSDSLQSENTKEVLLKFLEEELNIDNARKRIEFQSVHRVGKPRNLCSDPRMTIARFLCYQDREEDMQKARPNLKDKDYAVFEDIPKELYDLRKKQKSKFKTAKKNGRTAFFSKKYPDRRILTVNLYHWTNPLRNYLSIYQ